jgi:hypothetical protein
MKSPHKLLKKLLADVGSFHPSVSGLNRDIKTIEARLLHEGIGFIAVTLPRLGDALNRGLSEKRFCVPMGFKCSRGVAIPRFLGGMLSEVFEPSTGILKENPCPSVIRSLRQVLFFFKKSLIAEDEEFLNNKAKGDFYGCESNVVGEIPQPYLHRILRVGTYILGDLDILLYEDRGFQGRHGPGAVMEGVHGNAKWNLLGRYIRDGNDLFPESSTDLLFVNEERVGDMSSVTDVCCDSRLVTVPKSTTSRRTITVEPLMHQFYQQALNSTLRRSIGKCAVMSKCLDLTDQSKNQQLAMEGSRTGEWATLDLKSASDLLSTSLVEAVFCNRPEFYSRLVRSRSLMGGQPLRKYAGMGNATTFPIQSVVFALVAICAILDCEKKQFRRSEVVNAAKRVRVFGDDIIVPTYASRSVVAWLEACGLKVNLSKSFFEGNFRESCGVDAFNGVDVTPIYHRLDPRLPIANDSQVETAVSTANQLWLAGYYSAAEHLRQDVEKEWGQLLPVPITSGAVGFVWAGDPLLRWNRKLQIVEFKAYVSEAGTVKSRLDSYDALLKYFHTSLKERPQGHLEKFPTRYRNRLRVRWMPLNTVKSDLEVF